MMGLLGNREEKVPVLGTGGDDTPDMEPATLADAARQARASARSAPPPITENEGLPSVNRRRGNSKLVNILGVIFILAVGVVMIVAVNRPKAPAKPPKTTESDQVANHLPALSIPQPPPPSVVASAPVGAAAQPMISMQSASQAGKVLDWADRKRDGTLLIGSGMTMGGGAAPADTAALSTAPGNANGAALLGGGGGNDLALHLTPTRTDAVSAALLPDRNYLITKGTTLDCALETAFDSTMPGLTTCRLTRDVYSDNSQVLLLERGTQLVGEYQGGIKQGQARVFILWTRAKTPNGVIVSLNSPGIDALGRSGLDGWVDNHFAQRFGAAIMFSLLQDSLNYADARAQRNSNGSTVVLGNTQSAGEQAVGKILDNDMNIPPTLIKNQGDHIQIMVARDLDFSKVYDLRAKEDPPTVAQQVQH